MSAATSAQLRYYYKNKKKIAARRKAYRQRCLEQDPEYDKKRQQQWRKRQSPEKLLVRQAKGNAYLKDLDFNLTEEDINIPDVCPVFQVPFEPNTPYRMSIDRIDNRLGYVKGNVQIISLRANKMKHDASSSELECFARWILSE